jgi:hypothetical protein
MSRGISPLFYFNNNLDVNLLSELLTSVFTSSFFRIHSYILTDHFGDFQSHNYRAEVYGEGLFSKLSGHKLSNIIQYHDHLDAEILLGEHLSQNEMWTSSDLPSIQGHVLSTIFEQRCAKNLDKHHWQLDLFGDFSLLINPEYNNTESIFSEIISKKEVKIQQSDFISHADGNLKRKLIGVIGILPSHNLDNISMIFITQSDLWLSSGHAFGGKLRSTADENLQSFAGWISRLSNELNPYLEYVEIGEMRRDYFNERDRIIRAFKNTSKITYD